MSISTSELSAAAGQPASSDDVRQCELYGHSGFLYAVQCTCVLFQNMLIFPAALTDWK